MTISGFTMGKNVHKLYYPMKQSIMSILPIVKEFIVALGDNDSDDRTREEILSIGSPKIKIIDTVWDVVKYPRGTEHAHQTDIARSYCTGDWLFYLQSDEVVHENDLPVIEKRCKELHDDMEIEGLLFDYIHFWGDYKHHQDNHCWYRHEIRIIRNLPDIHSWESAQSFRHIPDFDGINYRRKENTFKLKVAKAYARIFHYGWVRPPELMNKKIKYFSINHRGAQVVNEMNKKEMFSGFFDYGNLKHVPVYNGTHPAVMTGWMEKFNWNDKLRFTGKRGNQYRLVNKHDKIKYRAISWVERNLLFGARLGGFNNYILIKR